MVQVSVIVATYNPDSNKLRASLDAIVSQKNINYEVIITDDGSKLKDFSWLPEYFGLHSVKKYTVLEHPQNMGTLKNLLAGISKATGDYVFLTSPGDILFDEMVLKDLYEFAHSEHYELCFGNAIFYSNKDDKLRITRNNSQPKRPELYYPGSRWAKTNFFGGDWVVGASCFRSRKFALHYFGQLNGLCTYAEDNPSTAFALANGIPLCYYDRNVIWYEDGSGISTSNNERWNRILKHEFENAFYKLKKQYPKDPLIDIAYINQTCESRIERIFIKTLKHPVVMLKTAIMRIIFKTKLTDVRQEDICWLQSILSGVNGPCR